MVRFFIFRPLVKVRKEQKAQKVPKLLQLKIKRILNLDLQEQDYKYFFNIVSCRKNS